MYIWSVIVCTDKCFVCNGEFIYLLCVSLSLALVTLGWPSDSLASVAGAVVGKQAIKAIVARTKVACGKGADRHHTGDAEWAGLLEVMVLRVYCGQNRSTECGGNVCLL